MPGSSSLPEFPPDPAADVEAKRTSDQALEEVLEGIRQSPRFAANVTHWQTEPARAARWAAMPEALYPEIRRALAGRGVERLYSHQAAAVEAALAGRDVTVVTPTASGKSLCYVLPVLQSLKQNPEHRALFLFPTKALSQDQYAEIHELSSTMEEGVKVYTYDGDTPAGARRAIRAAGQIVITNPDMLHAGILPHHTNWIKLFENLRWVVIDELHSYRGVFGSHVANVLRRLERISAFYKSRPQFVCCSATIANPGELATGLTGRETVVVDENGAPRGERHVLFYNPPVVNRELGIRRAAIKEARALALRFLRRDLQTILFARSRMQVELLTTYLKRAMPRFKGDAARIAAYRGGYLPGERREIERRLREGGILGVVSTNALELGIDIGRLRVAILCGYPGSIASSLQQAGRAGRTSESAAVILVGSSSPLNQFIVNHPDYFHGASPEAGIVNPDNVAILGGHVKCGCFEIPFEAGERFGTTDPGPILEVFDDAGVVRRTGDRYYPSDQNYPAEQVSLRTATAENFVIIDQSRENRVLGEVDYDSAPFLIHTGAIYIHQTQPYYVERLAWEDRIAYVRPIDTDYYTDAVAKTDIRVLREEARQGLGEQGPATEKLFGEVSVNTVVAQYKKVKFETHENIGFGEANTPENEMITEAWWLRFGEGLKQEMESGGLELASGLVGVANLMSNAVPVRVLCDRRDLRVVPMLRAPFDAHTALYLCDQYPGGIGIARRVYQIDREILGDMLEIVRRCPCSRGCPSCVGPAADLGSDRAKRSARWLIEGLRAQLGAGEEAPSA